MRVALDTNAYTDFAKGDAALVRILEAAEQILVPFIVVAELRAGFAVGKKGGVNENALRRFLSRDGVDLLQADEATTHHYASVYRQLREQGTPIPTNDIWIAALVLQHDLVLITRDGDFDHLPQIVRTTGA